MIILDTHMFYFLVVGAPIAFAEEYVNSPIAVSAITAAELACLQRLRRITFTKSADFWFEEAIQNSGVQILPVTPRILARAMLLEWDHRDPADRILWQTLLEHPGAELHTRDQRILARARETGAKVRDCRL